MVGRGRREAAEEPAGSDGVRGSPASWVEGLLRDLRHAARGLRRTPTVSLVAILTLALGIGANTAIFSVVRGVLIRPLPFPGSHDLFLLQETRPERGTIAVSAGNYLDWRARTATFESLAAYNDRSVTLETGGDPVRLGAAEVSGNFFHTLGADAALGRTFDPTFRVDPALRRVVMGHGLWQGRFGGDPSVVGRTVRIDGSAYEVVGVAAPGFEFPEGVDLWIRAAGEAPGIPGFDGDLSGVRTAWYFDVIGRLADGVGPTAARAELDAVAAGLRAEHPEANEGAGIRAVSLHEAVVGETRPLLLLLLGAVGLVLLVACANVASLVLSRAEGRRGELAIRAALGAGGHRLARFAISEGMVLAGTGAVLGVALAWLGLPLLLTLLPADLPRSRAITLDGAVLVFSLGITAGGCLLFTAFPALSARLTEPARALGERSGSGRGPGGRTLRQGIVVVELALAVLLVVGSGLVVRSVAKLASVDPGIEPEGLATVRVSLLDADELAPEERRQRWRRVASALTSRPEVSEAGLALRGPVSVGPRAGLRVVGRENPALTDDPSVVWRPVTPGYLPTLGVELLRGRGFEPGDREGGRHVGVVNETLARTFFPDGDVLGQRVTIGLDYGHEVEITLVGVVEDVRNQGPGREPLPVLYRPVDQADGFQGGTMTAAVRVDGDAASALGLLEATVRSTDPATVVYGPSVGPHLVASFLGTHRFVLRLLGLFAGLTVLLGAVGVYGVMAQSVGRRRREIGIRVAVGASRSVVVGMILRQGGGLVILGVALGLGAASVASRSLSAWLYEVGPADPLTYAAVALILTAVGLLAALVPARQALAIDPSEALRSE